jgi:hypothetical protein
MENISTIADAMRDMTSVKDLLDRWPSRAEVAADISAQGDEVISVDRVHKWARSGTIPPRFWARLIASAARREVPLTAEILVSLHDVRRCAA